jgi:hypothetical protein
MFLQIFTAIHVLISLVAVFSGLVVFAALLKSPQPHRWTGLFLWTTVATSITGFLFAIFPEFRRFSPAYAFSIISMIVLPVAFYALRTRRLVGGWRTVYIICAHFALFLNVVVLVVQIFQKVTPLHAVAPLQDGQPSGVIFAGAQVIVTTIFIVWGRLAVKRFRGASLEAGPV